MVKASNKRREVDVIDEAEVIQSLLRAKKARARSSPPPPELLASSEEDSADELSTEDRYRGESSSSSSRSADKHTQHTSGDGGSHVNGIGATLAIDSKPDPLRSRINLEASFRPSPATTVEASSAIAKQNGGTTFTSLGLSRTLQTALEAINIRKPTEIQSACIVPILQGGAKTGSGKTLAFALPIVERIARDPFGIWAVILTPTRELAYQLTEQFLAVGRPLGLTTITIVGGMDMLHQTQELERRPHIVVATPGRLCDLLRSDAMHYGKLSRVQTLVLDEADRLLTPTFASDLAFLFSQMPEKRQTCLFTATISETILKLSRKPSALGKKPPFFYQARYDEMTVAKLKQKYIFIPSQIRDPYLFYLLHHPPSDIDIALRSQLGRKRKGDGDGDDDFKIPSTIVFTQRCATAHLLHLILENLSISSVPLHSHLTQPQRLESLARFRAGEVPILVTTDVGSRGLDIPSVAMVVNWDCPRRPDDYIHRVGRTARAGRGGVAVTIVTERDVELVKEIEETVGVKMVTLELPEEKVLEDLNKVAVARRMATMEMHDSGFGERQAINKAKQLKRAKRDARI